MTKAIKEFPGVQLVIVKTITSKDGKHSVKTNTRKGDTTVGAFTSHLVEAVGTLTTGKAVHFEAQPIKSVRALFTNAGYSVVYSGKNKWELSIGENKFVLTNRTVTRSIKADNKTFERSVRRTS